MLLGANEIMKVVHTDHPTFRVLEQVAELLKAIELVGTIELLVVAIVVLLLVRT